MKGSFSTLILGYGNTLRGDDGAGYLVAETVAAWQVPHVRSLPAHQLLPEHSEAIASVERVIFVDAAITADRPTAGVALEPLAIGDSPPRSHHLTPPSLLNLARCLYGAKPDAYLLAIPAVDFTLGAELSPIARRGVGAAIECLTFAIGEGTGHARS